jgi:hypothetical protein
VNGGSGGLLPLLVLVLPILLLLAIALVPSPPAICCSCVLSIAPVVLIQRKYVSSPVGPACRVTSNAGIAGIEFFHSYCIPHG